MKSVKYIVVKLSSYDPNNGHQEWYEIQPQYDEYQIFIDMENINDKHR